VIETPFWSPLSGRLRPGPRRRGAWSDRDFIVEGRCSAGQGQRRFGCRVDHISEGSGERWLSTLYCHSGTRRAVECQHGSGVY
jgi:hypothetical protein